MPDMVEIQLCMGSSCFARGNNATLEALEDAIEKNGWKDRVSLAGMHCRNKCGEGPNVIVDGQLHTGIDSGTLLDMISRRLGGQTTGSSARLTR